MSLLSKAKAYEQKKKSRPKAPITHEHEDLAIAWMTGEITLGQAGFALGKTGTSFSGNVLYTFATALREAYRQGKIIIIQK